MTNSKLHWLYHAWMATVPTRIQDIITLLRLLFATYDSCLWRVLFGTYISYIWQWFDATWNICNNEDVNLWFKALKRIFCKRMILFVCYIICRIPKSLNSNDSISSTFCLLWRTRREIVSPLVNVVSMAREGVHIHHSSALLQHLPLVRSLFMLEWELECRTRLAKPASLGWTIGVSKEGNNVLEFDFVVLMCGHSWSIFSMIEKKYGCLKKK